MIEEIDVDLFAGGGGASEGIRIARGRAPAIAINHSADALACHEMNHPETEHFISDVFEVDPLEAVGARRVGLLWLSPDCTHHSKAKGGKPRDQKLRALADVVFMWLDRLPEAQRPRVIGLENVEEWLDWGPLGDDGKPIKAQKGEFFRAWVERVRSYGYSNIDWTVGRACDHGAPTMRKRMCLIARRDGQPITWPEPTHAKGGAKGKKPWRAAAEIIDWSIPCPSIFLTPEEAKALGVRRPLRPATMQRIARGVMRYVIEAAQPFIVPLTHHGADRGNGIDEPLATITCAHRGELAVVAPVLAGCGGRAAQTEPKSAGEPLNTITAKADQILVIPHVTKFNTGSTGSDVDDPLPTIVSSSAQDCNEAGAPTMGIVQAIAVPYMIPRYGEREGQEPRTIDVHQPAPTIVPTANGAVLVAPVMVHTAHGEHVAIGKKRGRGERDITEPYPTVTTSQDVGVAAAVMVPHLNTNRNAQKPFTAADEPTHTITAEGAHINVVSAFLAQYNNDKTGPLPGLGADEPVSTITTTGPHQGVIAAHLLNLKGSDRRDSDIADPAPAICANGNHVAEVRAFLMKYYGAEQPPGDLLAPLHTVTSKPRFALVTIAGEQYEIVDIGMRMLTPRELFRAQGFRDDYIIDRRPDGSKLPKSAQVRHVGNSVSPPWLAAIIAANLEPLPLTMAKAA